MPLDKKIELGEEEVKGTDEAEEFTEEEETSGRTEDVVDFVSSVKLLDPPDDDDDDVAD